MEINLAALSKLKIKIDKEIDRKNEFKNLKKMKNILKIIWDNNHRSWKVIRMQY
jgi:hypothetical protein